MLVNGIQVVFGAAGFITGSVGDVQKWLQVVEEVAIKTIDTAALYGESEQLLGEAAAAQKFTIDTKHPGGFGAQFSTRNVVIASFKKSLQALKADSVSSRHAKLRTWIPRLTNMT